MFINYLEDDFKRLGLPPERPRLILAIPLVACLTTDRGVSKEEAGAISEFARETLDYDVQQMRFLHQWLETPPSDTTVSRAVDLICELIEMKDMVTIETKTVSKVMMECERLLRAREVQNHLESPRGRALLENISGHLGIDLGLAWQDMAPEVFDEHPQPRSQRPASSQRAPVRRLRTAVRQEERSPHESGGLI